MLPFHPRIGMSAHIEPGPAVKAPVLDMGDVIGNEIIAKPIALIGRTPEFAGCGIEGNADRIANAGSINAKPGTVGIEFENVGAIRLVVSLVHVLFGSN